MIAPSIDREVRERRQGVGHGRREDFERWGGAAAWSASAELTPMQTLLWRAERHPVQSSTSTVVIDLDRAPDWKRFVAATEWGTGLVRRLRQHVVEPVVPTAAPTWADVVVANVEAAAPPHVLRLVQEWLADEHPGRLLLLPRIAAGRGA